MSRKQRYLAKMGMTDTRQQPEPTKQQSKSQATTREADPQYQPAISPKPVTGMDMALGGDMDKLLPPMSAIPAEFKSGRNPYVSLQQEWFFRGLDSKARLITKPGVHRGMALQHLTAIQHSFEPAHEHKEAGVAYLMSLWFDLA
jgi:hypothetical protein